MSSGTLVKVERYYNHFHLHSLEHLRDEREKTVKRLETLWGEITALAMATPKDITPNDDTPEAYIYDRIADIREQINDCEYALQAYSDIEECWETREED